MQHTLLHCSENLGLELLGRTGREELKKMLSQPKSMQTATQWLVQQGAPKQFDTAKEIEEEDTMDYTPF